MEGWIKLNRQIKENFLWSEKPFDKKSAWIDLLLSANYKENKFMLGAEVITVPAGAFVTSELKLMERWGWSKSKVRNFLNMLESEKMIEKNTDRKKTTVNIVNYELYQGYEDHEKTIKRPQKDTNKKEKKEKNNNIIYIDLTFIDDVVVNVNLTEEQYNKLVGKFGDRLVNEKIIALNMWITEKKVKDHYLTLNNWCRKDASETTKTFEKRNAPRPNFD